MYSTLIQFGLGLRCNVRHTVTSWTRLCLTSIKPQVRPTLQTTVQVHYRWIHIPDKLERTYPCTYLVSNFVHCKPFLMGRWIGYSKISHPIITNTCHFPTDPSVLRVFLEQWKHTCKSSLRHCATHNSVNILCEPVCKICCCDLKSVFYCPHTANTPLMSYLLPLIL